MKRKTVVESFDDLSPEMIELEPDRHAQASPKARPVGLQQPREIPMPILAPEHTIFTGYPHWGLNE